MLGEDNHNNAPSNSETTLIQGNAESAAVAAAVAAARLNAQLVAQGLAAPGSDGGPTQASDNVSPGKQDEPPVANKDRDGFFFDIDINDVKHRYILTKGAFQTQVNSLQPLTFVALRLNRMAV
jgi:hypothetical protein